MQKHKKVSDGPVNSAFHPSRVRKSSTGLPGWS